MSRPLVAVAALSLAVALYALPAPRACAGAGDSLAVSAAPLTPAARGELSRRFVLKWGQYVQRVYGVPVGAWAKRMVPNFVAADPANFRRALQRDTFEGAAAALAGSGLRVTDAMVIDRMARATQRPRGLRTSADLPAIGSLASDLVYTPLAPCRIADTRIANGPIVANGSRDFRAINASSFANQGGSGGNCGTLGLSAAAVVLNVTAVSPTGAGYATVYPFGTARPGTASVNYVGGAIVNNAIIAQIPNPLAASDFTLYTYAESHYVIDIVGYFAPPVATPLDCTQTFTGNYVNAGATFDHTIPACAAGYVLVGAGCRTLGSSDADWSINGLYQPSPGTLAAHCAGRNKTAGTITVEGVARCCRLPGR